MTAKVRLLFVLASIGASCVPLVSTAATAATVPPAQGATSARATAAPVQHAAAVRLRRNPVSLLGIRNALQAGAASLGAVNTSSASEGTTITATSAALSIQTKAIGRESVGTLPTVPLWSYALVSPRDGFHHSGAIVGTDPVNAPGVSHIPTYIVPIVLQTQTIGIAFDKKTGLITATAPGLTQFDPTSPDTTCLSPPNDIPIKLVEQSPIFQPTNFSFGGINLGTAQYADAFQRANLSTLLGPNATHYSVLLDPITTLASVRVSIPANEGLALTNGAILGPPRFCAPLALIDVIWLDSYLTGAVIPRLIQNGLSPNALPIFIIYNALLTDPTTAVPTSMVSLATSATGYYSVTGTPIPVQGYIVSDFDSSAVLAPILENVQDLSAEVTSWINNPYAVSNFTPPYAGAGASSIVNSACSNLMEVATPLFPRPFTVVGSNGFSYSLQEAAYFSWFFGGPSAGPQGFFSNNGTLQGGAGSPCP